MNPPTLNTPLPSKPVATANTVPWPTSDDRPAPPQGDDPQRKVGDLRADPNAAVLVMSAGHEHSASPGGEADRSTGATMAKDARHALSERMRHAVQSRPLAAVATALALGAVLARIAR